MADGYAPNNYPQIRAYRTKDLLTLSLPPYTVQTFERALGNTVIRSMSDSQLSQFVYRDAYLKRVWTVQVPYFNNLQRDELDYFYTYVHGMVMPFKWWNLSEHNVQPQQAPDTYYPIAEPGVLHFVRFGMDTLHFDRVFKDAWSATITLEEAHPIEIDWEGYTPSVDDVVDGLGNTGV